MRWYVTAPLVVALLLWVDFGQAHALSARVRWLPTTEEAVAGYYVYVRPAGEPYCEEPACNGQLDRGQWDAGLPLADTDGTMTTMVQGLNDLATVGAYYFALTAYNSDLDQSALSNEVHLGDVDPCEVDRCPSLGFCYFGILLTEIQVRRFKVGLGRGGPELSAVGLLWPALPLDPTRTGVTLEIDDNSGAVLYRAVVPGDDLVANRRGTMFKLDPSKEVGASGLLRLSLRQSRSGQVTATVKAAASELANALERHQLTWILRPGDECFVAEDLTCLHLWLGGIRCR